MSDLKVRELKERMEQGDAPILIDVREQSEYGICRIPARLIPLAQLPAHFHEFDPGSEIVVHCPIGGRERAGGRLHARRRLQTGQKPRRRRSCLDQRG